MRSCCCCALRQLMPASASGSRITTALRLPIPLAKERIQRLYASAPPAPPAEYCPQSRFGILYATKTGSALAPVMRETALETSRPMSTFQPPIHCASGCAAILSISAASAGRLLRHASAWRFAEEAGSTKSFAPEKRFMNARLTVCARSEEHTSELQSRRDLVCRLLLEKKKHVD